MSKQNPDDLSKSNQLLKALTQSEITRFIDALLGALSPELEEQAISQLPADTQQIVRQILAPSPLQAATKSTVIETVSLAKQAEIWTGLWREWDNTANKETALWKSILADIHSCWQQFYLHSIEQYAPDRYLTQLRTTIPQQWQNGLPIIEELLNEQNYSESLVAIEETLSSLLKPTRSDLSWNPETSMLVAIPGLYYEVSSEW